MEKIVAALAVLMLCACSPQPAATLVITPSALPSPTAASTATAIPPKETKPRPTHVATITLTPTLSPAPYTPFPSYPTKAILLDYSSGGSHTLFDFVRDYSYSNLVLYSDGQMIVPGKTYLQKKLSEEEINLLMTRLDQLGFFRIESNQKHDETDHLYNFGSHYSRIFDSHWDCILVNGDRPRNLCAQQMYADYLVPEMKNTLKFLDDYPTDGMIPYIPDRIVLWVDQGRSSQITNLPAAAIPWPESLPSLVKANHNYLYAGDESAKAIHSFLEKNGWLLVCSENGQEYTVTADIILPHEELTWPFHDNPPAIRN
jgi:hypothetical protein